MLFLRGRMRPIDVDDPGKIHFEDFPGIPREETTLGKVRHLARRLAQSAQVLVVDRETGAFLKGGPTRTLERKPIAMATAFAQVLGEHLASQPTPPAASVPPPPPGRRYSPAEAAAAGIPTAGTHATKPWWQRR
jgi:hypothetical protein